MDDNMQFYVKMTDWAFVGLVMNGIESFLLPQMNTVNKRVTEKTKGHEIHGYIFGKLTEKPTELHYSIEHINIDTTSATSQDGVCPVDACAALKQIICESFFNNRLCLGTVHTHPYRLREKKGEMLSKCFSPEMYIPTQDDEDYGGIEGELDLILTIVNSRRVLTNDTKYVDNLDYCFQFDINMLRFFLAAYVREGEDARYASYNSVHLEIPKVASNMYILENYDIIRDYCASI